MLQLILVRHGETDCNVRYTYAGWTDAGLNDNGIKQAYCVKEKLSGEKVDAIYASPLKRAGRTAEIINENFNLDISFVDELKERNFGIFEDLTHEEINARYPVEYDLWMKDPVNYRIEGGESSLDGYHRKTGFIDRLVGEKNEGTFLIVTHLGCIRKIVAHLLGMGIAGTWRFKVGNCGITRIMVNEQKFAYLTALNA